MKRNFIALLALLALSALPAKVFAGKSNAGTSGAKFLRLGPGARPAGMGEAFATIAGDVHGVYYNPAALADLEKPVASGMHNQYFQGFDYNFMAYVAPVKAGRSALGLALYNLSVDGLERRTNDTDLAIGAFKASDFAYGLSYGHKLMDSLSLGVNVKYVRQVLDSVRATAWSFDLGSRYSLPGRPLVLAAGARHLGSKPKFREVASPLPSIYYLGASYPLLDEDLRLAFELGLPRDQEMLYNLGAEYARHFSAAFGFAVRGGYSSANKDPGDMAGVALGVGLMYRRLSFDFAWVPFGDLGNTFRYSILLRF